MPAQTQARVNPTHRWPPNLSPVIPDGPTVAVETDSLAQKTVDLSRINLASIHPDEAPKALKSGLLKAPEIDQIGIADKVKRPTLKAHLVIACFLDGPK